MRLAAVLVALTVAMPLAAGPVLAAPKPQGPMQTCTAQWMAMRQAGDLRGQNYKSFIRLCLQGKTTDWTPAGAKTARKTAPAEARAFKSKPLKAKALKAKSSEKKSSTGGGISSGGRMKACGAKWQAMKAANATNGQTWRQFSRQCLKNP